MPHFLDNICAIIGTFDKYAQPNGDRLTLHCREVKRLILKEFAEAIEVSWSCPAEGMGAGWPARARARELGIWTVAGK